MKNGFRQLIPGLMTGALLALACAQDEDEPLNEEVRAACSEFCDRAIECDEDIIAADRDDCLTDCYGTAEECADVNELDEGVAQMEDCAQTSCDEFYLCNVDLDLECFL
jgi:hypothetical protein